MSVAAPAKERDRLLAMSPRMDSLEFLGAAWPRFASRAEDVELGLQVIRHLSALALGPLALDAFERLPEDFRSSEDGRALQTQIQRLPATVQSPAVVQGRFRRNLAVLRERGVALGTTPDAFEAEAARWRGRHVVLLDARRRPIVAQREADGRLTPLNLAPEAAEAERIVLPHTQDIDTLCPRPYVFEGIDPPYLALRVWRETTDLLNGYSPMVYILAPSADSFLTPLHLHDLSAMLDDERVRVIVAPDATVRLLEQLLDDDDLSLPKYLFTLPAARGLFQPPIADALSKVDETRTRRAKEVHEKVAALYRDRDARWWARRYDEALNGTGPALRIFLPVSRFTNYIRHAARQLAGAFERAGCEVRILTEANDHTEVPPIRYFDTFAHWQPDLVVKIDHLRHESAHAFPDSIPFLCWVQDVLPNLFSPDAGPQVDPMQVVIGLGAEQLISEHGYPPERTIPVLNGSDPTVYSHEPLPEDELAPHRCDVAWVTNHSEPPEELFERLVNRHVEGEPARKYARSVFERIRSIFANRPEPSAAIGFPLLMLNHPHGLENQFDRAGLHRLHRFFALPIADRFYRHQTLEWVIGECERAGRTLHLYGRGWERDARTRPFARGVVENGRALRAVYQAARVNLHTSVFGSLHQRVFDGFASGGLVLCRAAFADHGRRLYETASREAARLGRREFALGEAPELKSLVESIQKMPLGGRGRWDLDAPRWWAWQGERTPCRFRSFDELAPDFEAVTFDSPESLADRLACFLNDADARSAAVEPMRRRVVTELSIDAIARHALTRVREAIDVAAAPIATR